MVSRHTPTPWRDDIGIAGWQYFDSADPHQEPNRLRIAACVNAFHSEDDREIPTEAIAPGLFWEAVDALRLHHAWAQSENTGPDYNGLTRDTHPDGEAIWKAWWDGNLSLCDRAGKATSALLAKLEPQK